MCGMCGPVWTGKWSEASLLHDYCFACHSIVQCGHRYLCVIHARLCVIHARLCVFQVDYAMDVFKQLYPDSPDPEGKL